MDISAVGAASIQMSLVSVAQSVDIFVAKEAMSLAETQSAALIADLQQMISSFEHSFDVSV